MYHYFFNKIECKKLLNKHFISNILNRAVELNTPLLYFIKFYELIYYLFSLIAILISNVYFYITINTKYTQIPF